MSGKIGIFGGSFNPIHQGHLIIAETIGEKFALDKVIFVPVGSPSHRENNLAKPEDRLEMVKLAISGNKRFDVSEIEVENQNTSYTIDTLMKIKKIYGGENDYYEIIGEDSADYLHKWKNYERLLENATFVVFKRRGFSFISNSEKIILCDTPIIEISSTEIRRRVYEGKSIKYLLPEPVEAFIEKNKLYRNK